MFGYIIGSKLVLANSVDNKLIFFLVVPRIQVFTFHAVSGDFHELTKSTLLVFCGEK